MHNIQMETNKVIAMKEMDMEMETKRLDMEARREAVVMQLMIVKLFSNNLHSAQFNTMIVCCHCQCFVYMFVFTSIVIVIHDYTLIYMLYLHTY
jgi:hypothetical protein